MVTEKYYYIEPYRRELDALVTAVEKNGIILDRTIAYPEGGGQPGDRGTINNIPFKDTQKSDEAILHVMDTSSFCVGDSVHIVLDWNHRYEYMQQHTAQHMLSGIMFQSEKIGTLSVHQGEDILTIETDRMDISEETLFHIEELANRAVNENHPVSYLEVSHKEAEDIGLRRSIKVSGDVRLVKIDNVDIIACGGIHVAHTGEVGTINYVGSEQIRGHVRTMWRTAERATRARRINEKAVHAAGAVLSAPAEKLVSSAERLVQENKQLSYDLRQCEKKLASFMVSSAREKGVHVITSDIPLSAFQDIFSSEDRFLVINSSSQRLSWLLHVDEEVFKNFKARFSELGMKGGGRGHLFQGSAPVEKREQIAIAAMEVLGE